MSVILVITPLWLRAFIVGVWGGVYWIGDFYGMCFWYWQRRACDRADFFLQLQLLQLQIATDFDHVTSKDRVIAEITNMTVNEERLTVQEAKEGDVAPPLVHN